MGIKEWKAYVAVLVCLGDWPPIEEEGFAWRHFFVLHFAAPAAEAAIVELPARLLGRAPREARLLA